MGCSENDEIISSKSQPLQILSLDSLRISDSAITAINLDSFLDPDSIARFSLNSSCRVIANGKTVNGVTLTLLSPADNIIIASSNIDSISILLDTATISGPFALELPRTTTGLFTLQASVYGPSGYYPGSIQRQIRLSKNNTPPTLDSVFFSADTIDVTLEPYRDTLIVKAKVTDQDGAADIRVVEAVFSGFPFEMFDDGDLPAHGDAFTGDQVYSRGFTIDSTNSSGSRTFRFRAVDGSGDTSQVLEKSFFIKSLK